MKSELPQDIKDVLLDLAKDLDSSVDSALEEYIEDISMRIGAIEECLDDGNKGLIDFDYLFEAVEDLEENIKELSILELHCYECDKLLGTGRIEGAEGEDIKCRECSA